MLFKIKIIKCRRARFTPLLFFLLTAVGEVFKAAFVDVFIFTLQSGFRKVWKVVF